MNSLQYDVMADFMIPLGTEGLLGRADAEVCNRMELLLGRERQEV
jgi:hypothetical protein